MEYELERTQRLPRGLEETFAFFSQTRNLEAITPAWLNFQILEAPERLERNSLLRYRLRLFAVPVGWRTAISDWRPPYGFEDTQLSGPYRLWVHTHRFTTVPGGTEVYDNVRYRIPGGALAPLVHRLLVRRLLRSIFDFRAERLAALLAERRSAPRASPYSCDWMT